MRNLLYSFADILLRAPVRATAEEVINVLSLGAGCMQGAG
jgi:hypothetical protein